MKSRFSPGDLVDYLEINLTVSVPSCFSRTTYWPTLSKMPQTQQIGFQISEQFGLTDTTTLVNWN